MTIHNDIPETDPLEMDKIIIDNSPIVLFRRMAGDDPKLIYVSENIRNFGYAAEEFLRGDISLKDIIHPDDIDRVGNEIQGYVDKNIETYSQKYRILSRDGQIRWVADQTSVIRDKNGVPQFHQGVLGDITERKIAETAMARSEEKYRRIVSTTAQGFFLVGEQMGISDVNDTFCRLLGYTRDELLGKAPHELATPEFSRFIQGNRERLMKHEPKETEGEFLTRDGRRVPVLLHSNPLTDDNDDFMGIMLFVTDMTEHKKAMALAGEVQKNLMPQAQPVISGFDIAGKSQPCDEIGGDYFDFIYQGKTQRSVGVVIGDVTGHGLDAALFMTTARGFLRMRATQSGSAAQVITDMNQHLSKDVLESGRFMTLFFICLEPDSNSLQWVRAGHDPAMVYDPGTDTFETLMGRGTALGVDGQFTYTEQTYKTLTQGKIIALATDGTWEATDPRGTMFGKDRLRKAIRQNADKDARSIVDAVFTDIRNFTASRKPLDDITLVIIRRV